MRFLEIIQKDIEITKDSIQSYKNDPNYPDFPSLDPNISEYQKAMMNRVEELNTQLLALHEEKAERIEHEMKKTIKFEVGKTYRMRFIGDSELKVPVTVVSRTAKFITVRERNEEPKRIGVQVWDNSEVAYPSGTYSMAPSIRAKRP